MVAKSIAKMYTNIHKPTDYTEEMSQLWHSTKNSNMFLSWFHQIIESAKTYIYYVLCLQVVATQSARMLNSSAFVTSVMIIDRIFRSLRHSDRM